MWNMTLRVCLNRSVFLLLSLSRELSPFLLHKHVLNPRVSKLFILSHHSLYKFHVSCFVFSHFNSLPPASLSLLLHFNCDFHGYLTRSRSTCIKCPSRTHESCFACRKLISNWIDRCFGLSICERIFCWRYNSVPLIRRLSHMLVCNTYNYFEKGFETFVVPASSVQALPGPRLVEHWLPM